MIATEKLDGSNLGIEFNNDGKLIAFHGRNVTIWSEPEPNPFNRKYGHVKRDMLPLEPTIPLLSAIVPDFVVEGCVSVIIHGEWYQSGSFHPFGYVLRMEDGTTLQHMMTLTLHKKFVDAGLVPPRILYSDCGTMLDLIESLHSTMLDPVNSRFEGVFITFNHNELLPRHKLEGWKWKVGLFEEQPKWVIQEYKLRSELLPFVAKLRSVFDRKSVPAAPPSKEEEDNTQIRLAFDSVMSKYETPVVNLDSKEKFLHITRVNQLVIDEVKLQYSLCDSVVDEVKLLASVKRLVPRMLFRK